MSMPDLAAILWRQRELLERLVYRLECEQLLLAAGRTRFLATATGEVEALLDELAVVEVQRAARRRRRGGRARPRARLRRSRSSPAPRSRRGPRCSSTTGRPCSP